MVVTPHGAGAPNLPPDTSPYRYNFPYVCLISAVAALGGLLFGYDWVVIGGAKPFYEPYFRLTSETQSGWANSCALLGCLMGSILSGALSDRIGRKPLLILAAVCFGVSSIATGWASSFDVFILWRVLGGVAIGMASNVSPTYIAEVAPARWRGALVTLNQLTIVVGILAAQIVNLIIAGPVAQGATEEMIRQSWQGQFGWRWMFTAVALPSAIFFFFSFLVPESPRYLISVGKLDQARAILKRIGGPAYAEAETGLILKSVASPLNGRGHWRDLFRPGVFAVVLIGVFLAALQQWSGTNVIFNYAEEIYRGAGYDLSAVMFNIVITGAINLLFTLVATATVDRFGRRGLMLWGCAGMALAHLALGLVFFFGVKGPLVLGLTLAVIAVYAMSLAPVTWVLLAEIFPSRIRGLAMSVAISALWIACFGVTFTFPLLNKALGAAGTFWLYGAICLLGFVILKAFVPETKGQSLEEIELSLTEQGG